MAKSTVTSIEDLDSIPSTIWRFTTICNSKPMGLTLSSDLQEQVDGRQVDRYTDKTLIHIKNFVWGTGDLSQLVVLV